MKTDKKSEYKKLVVRGNGVGTQCKISLVVVPRNRTKCAGLI